MLLEGEVLGKPKLQYRKLDNLGLTRFSSTKSRNLNFSFYLEAKGFETRGNQVREELCCNHQDEAG